MDGQMQSCRKRVRDDESNELELELAAVKRLRDDLLGVFDDSDPDSAGQDLDSVMRSFQEEISAASTSASSSAGVIDPTSDSSESRSELGYLLEASDDDLGLPPSTAASEDEVVELAPVPSNSSGIGELWGLESFDNQIPSYEPFEFGGAGEGPEGEYVVFDDCLFGFASGCFDPSEVADYS